jgi:hypothetical protein
MDLAARSRVRGTYALPASQPGRQAHSYADEGGAGKRGILRQKIFVLGSILLLEHYCGALCKVLLGSGRNSEEDDTVACISQS